jgi:hypothetical protein
MKRKRVAMLVLSLLALSFIGIGVRYAWKKQAKQKREIGYQSALRSYSEVLKPGMTREEVENYLRTKNTEFRHMCCINGEIAKGVWDDLTKVGEEDAPWYCGEHNVYIAFQFTSHKRQEGTWEAHPTDVLKSITVHHELEGCL